MKNRIKSVGAAPNWLIAVTLVALFIVAGASTASADVITFNVTGDFANGAVFNIGSFVTINNVLGTAIDSNLMISAGSNSPANTFTGVPNISDGSFMTAFVWQLADDTRLEFYPVGSSFQGFTGGAISAAYYYNNTLQWYSNGSFDTVLTVASTSVTEPAAISLLVIGLLPLMGMTSRRKRLV